MFSFIKACFIAVLIFFLGYSSIAQTPSTCFEIESILVDACDPNNIEGANEMVRFAVGPNPLNTSNLNISWPNNPFKGICQNGTTASKVASLNSSIVGCGLLKEPSGGIIPANSKAIIITSTDFNVAANSFANLNDTLYIIFQCSGNTAGHFANYSSSSGLRTLSMTFSSPSGCSDVVTYDRSLLINQSGGSSAEDGATVEFDWSGNPTYQNYGCTAPIEQKSITINESGISICPGDTINLSAVLQGTFSITLWTGGNGNFSSSSALSTLYYSDASDNSDFYIYIEGQTSCSQPIKDSILIQIGGNSNASISIINSNIQICSGDTIELSASTNGTLSSTTWSGGNGNFSSSNSLTTSYYSSNLDNVDFYIYINGISSCGEILKDSILIQIGANNSSVSIQASTTELCSGDSILLSAVGSGNYTWNTGSNSASIYVSQSGNYSVTSTSTCGSATDNITISDAPTINLNLTTSSNDICDGTSATLTASGADNYIWFNDNTGSSELINSSGYYYVIGYNNCYRDSQSVFINVITEPTISILSSNPNNQICSGETITLTVSGSDNYIWNTSDTSSSIAVTSAGTYSVSSSNSCFTTSTSITILNGNVPFATITGDTILCDDEITTLTANGGSNYLWSTGSSSQITNITMAESGFVIVSNSCGSDTAYFNVHDYSINVSFTSDYEYGIDLPASINFNNTSETPFGNYFWSFGDGSQSNENNPTHSFSETGEYIVTLSDSNAFCKDSYSETLVFESPNTIFIPNVFTPNNDNVNDFFLIKGYNISSLDCKIFNRWGEKIYSWNEIDGFWDGSYNGKAASDGTYFYILKVEWNNDEKETLTGHITLLK